MTPDPRLTLARDGLASADLQGVASAAAYRPTSLRQCVALSADLRRAPHPLAEQDDQLLFGEQFEVLQEKNGYALGRMTRDGYVGWLPAQSLAAPGPTATHRVSALRAHAFAGPDFKTAAEGPYALNALLAVEDEQGRYLKAAGAGWFAKVHLSLVGVFETDPATVAELFLHAPYRWGGRDGMGMDCSGLVQQSLFACGLACPRDADQQAAIGRAVGRQALCRSDLVFWPGHVGMMLDEARLIHANSFSMAVVIEPLETAIARIDDLGSGPPTAFRRVEV
jgi:cell wall-associated NlpC family hydrolase